MPEKSVLFVCLGNICRSPLADGIFRDMVTRGGLDIAVDSAGTGDWHLGHAPDKRSQAIAAKMGLDITDLRARLVVPGDFHEFSHVIAMDSSNLTNLKAMQPADTNTVVARLLDYAPEVDITDVPDPYYGGDDGFVQVFDLVQAGCRGLLADMTKSV